MRNEQILKSPSDRKGEIHPGLDNFISSEYDRSKDEYLIRDRYKEKDSEIGQYDDYKMTNQDQMQRNSSMYEPPFKIIRKCPTICTRKPGTQRESNPVAADMETFYLHSALNYDENISHKVKLNLNEILRNIFKEVRRWIDLPISFLKF